MIKQILSYRAIAVIIAVFIFLNAISFTVGGIFLAVKGIYLIFTEGLLSESRPGILILESVDVFLLALVFLIFAIGIVKLFVPDAHQLLVVTKIKWLKIHNFTELKLLLWEAIMVTLVVFFLTYYIHQSEDHISWDLLILPVSIFLLAISYYVMRKSEPPHQKQDDETPSIE